MIIFPHLRTKRLSVELCELTLGEAVAVCKLPAERTEATATQFLRVAARKAAAPQPHYVTDPQLWTVQERALVIATYLSRVADDGPDFAVGGGGRFSDYVTFDRDYPSDSADAGEVAGTKYTMHHLLGWHAELLEHACADSGEWLIGAMACTLHAEGQSRPAWGEATDAQALEWLQDRMAALRSLPESEFEALLMRFWAGMEALGHLFRFSVDALGVVFDSNPSQEAGPAHPARFRADACIGQIARRLSGRAE